MCVAGPGLLHTLGATRNELIKLENGVSTANNAGLTLLGGLFCNIRGWTPGGKQISTQQLIYIAEGINTLFLSKTACRDLQIIGHNFPEVGSIRGLQKSKKEPELIQEPETGEATLSVKQCKP